MRIGVSEVEEVIHLVIECEDLGWIVAQRGVCRYGELILEDRHGAWCRAKMLADHLDLPRSRRIGCTDSSPVEVLDRSSREFGGYVGRDGARSEVERVEDKARERSPVSETISDVSEALLAKI
jgi:hypothetical protein